MQVMLQLVNVHIQRHDSLQGGRAMLLQAQQWMLWMQSAGLKAMDLPLERGLGLEGPPRRSSP